MVYYSFRVNIIAIDKSNAAINAHRNLPNDPFSEGTITDSRFREEYPGWAALVQSWKAFDVFKDAAESRVEMDSAGSERWIMKYTEYLEESWEKHLKS